MSQLRTPLSSRSARLTVIAASVVVGSTLLSGCGALQPQADRFLGVLTPYRIDIVQGNVVTKEQAALLRPGLSRTQVRDILGSPLVTDLFHADRWDYLFTIRRPGTEPQRRSVVVLFDGDVVKEVRAPDLPSEREFVASIAPNRSVRVPPLELTEAQRQALPPPVRRDEAPSLPPAQGPARTYPPLEP